MHGSHLFSFGLFQVVGSLFPATWWSFLAGGVVRLIKHWYKNIPSEPNTHLCSNTLVMETGVFNHPRLKINRTHYFILMDNGYWQFYLSALKPVHLTHDLHVEWSRIIFKGYT